MDSLEQPKEKKIMGTARSCFFVVGSAEYSRFEGVISYELLKPNKTITEELRLQLMRLNGALRETGHNTSRGTKT